jgi:hypothetical protein
MDIVVMIGFNQLFQTAQQPECPPYRQPCLSEETGAPARMSGRERKMPLNRKSGEEKLKQENRRGNKEEVR